MSSLGSRTSLLNLLSQYQPIDPVDQGQTKIISDFVSLYPHCFDRTLLIGHITGSAWVMDESGQRVLLTHHKKLNKWLQLGGHADGNADVWAVALREAQEESGLKTLRPLSKDIFDLDIHPIPERSGEPAHLHYDIRFAFRASGQEPLVISDESNELSWIPLEDLENYSQEPALLRMREKWRIRQ